MVRSRSLLRPAVLTALVVLAACSMMRPVPAPLIPPPPAVTPYQAAAPRVGLALDPVTFAALQGWRDGDPRKALEAFRGSCAALLDKAADASMGGAGYAGKTTEWRDACPTTVRAECCGAESARNFFED